MANFTYANNVKLILQTLSQQKENLQTGDKLRDLVNEVCRFFIPPFHGLVYGGRIVPQTGSDAGNDIYDFSAIQSSGTISDDAVGMITSKVSKLKWNILDEATKKHISEKILKNKFLFIARPISGVFSRSIGYVWAICNEKSATITEDCIEMSSSFISLFMHQILTQNALEMLGKPQASEIKSFEEGACFISEALLSALSCKAVIIWRLVVDAETGKIELQTIATAGEASGLGFSMEYGEGVAGKCAELSSEILIDDLLDKKELDLYDIKRLAQEKIVRSKKWGSAYFVPLEIKNKILGVVGCYVSRKSAFTSIECEVCRAFTQKFCVMIDSMQRNEEQELIKKRLIAASPIIEAGLLAMENMHDVLNTLLVVQDKIENIKRKYKKGESAHDIADRIVPLVDKASTMLNITVRQGKIDQLNLSKIDIKSIINSVVLDLQDLMNNHKIIIDCSVKTQKIYADELKIRRVFWNLFDNSIYFLKQRFKRERRKIKISSELKSDRVIIIFEDNGRGIQDSVKPHIFKFLFSTKGEFGSGLGLAICETIIQAHRGRIWVDSIFGQYAKFFVELPLNYFSCKG
ncbi:histidine kinase [Solidesulfovibrio fructosivorans JJ]]|uniref:histidine kinase n=1 Tax=Solidesulfovibrio fructosivorans JJ] TaxID=596151 RepID=E1JT76_SOLFR|nr:GAF domain-containing sensor histidine kinase [Solidesulfovibrio fructosivorans]EFL52336.1 histidine kinase [Solidesulfovibrio fructosivorans JJ]]